MKINFRRLFLHIAIPLLVGAVSAFLSGEGMREFAMLKKPPLSPPGWLFPVVWTILYVLMGIASYLVAVSGPAQYLPGVRNTPYEEALFNAQTVYGYQLTVNFFWSIFFFGFGWYTFSFVWLVLLWLLILLTIFLFYRFSKPAAYLLIPYLLWVTFAGYLNLGIALLN